MDLDILIVSSLIGKNQKTKPTRHPEEIKWGASLPDRAGTSAAQSRRPATLKNADLSIVPADLLPNAGRRSLS
jgi:hypothetical protein